jgi:RNA polymerase II subunit A small phosphatase-like protein
LILQAFASIVTQVSNTGQPARGPSRPVRPRQGQGQRKPSTKAASSTAPKAATSTTPASSSSQANTDATIGTSASAPVASDTATSTSKPVASSVAATTTTASPPSTGQSSTNKAKATTVTTPEAAPTASSAAQAPSPPSPKARQLQKPNSNNAGGSSALNKQQQHNNKKRKSWFSSMFSSCFTGGSAHDDEDAAAGGAAAGNNNATASMTERKAGTANATRPVTSTSTSSTSPNRQNVGTSASSPQTPPIAADGKHAKKDATLLDKKKNEERMIKVIPDPAATTSATNPSDSQNHGAAGLALGTAAGAGAVAAGGLLHPNSTSSEGNDTAGPNVTRGLSSSPHSEIAPEVLAANQTGGTPLSRDETADVLSGAVQAPGSEGLTPKKEKRRKSSSGERGTHGQQHDDGSGDISRVSSFSSDEETGDESADRGKDNEEALAEDSEEEEYVDEEERIIAAGGMGIPVDENGNPAPLLKELTPSYKGKKCLVLDLDETLVHSSFKVSQRVMVCRKQTQRTMLTLSLSVWISSFTLLIS